MSSIYCTSYYDLMLSSSEPSGFRQETFCHHEEKVEDELFDQDDMNQVLGGLQDSGLEEVDLNLTFLLDEGLQEPSSKPLDPSTSSFDMDPIPLCDTEAFQIGMGEDVVVPFSQQQQQQSHPSAPQEDEIDMDESAEEEEEEEPMEKPKRSLTAYNLFFQDERKRLLATLPVKEGKRSTKRCHGKLSFAEMARTVAANWKKISKEDKMEYEARSELDKERFEREFAAWKKSQSTGNLKKKSSTSNNNRSRSTGFTATTMRGYASDSTVARSQQQQVVIAPYTGNPTNINFQWQQQVAPYQNQGIESARNMFLL